MFELTGLDWLGQGRGAKLLAVVLVLQVVFIVLIIADVRASRRANQRPLTVIPNPTTWWRPNLAKPTRRPPILKATEAKIRSDELVIGVEVRGKARAYRLAAFNDASGHLVNDLIGGVPVSVAYCNLSDTVRVYTDPNGSSLLDAEIPGLFKQQMVIRLKGHLYFHVSGQPVEPEKRPPPIPYTLLTPTLTNWQDWKKQRPETDIFAGGRGSERP
jgi:hypothetical protein